MKKVMIGFALVCFVAFGTLGIQNAAASTDNVEIVKLNLDDDPDKDKKAEAKTDGKDKKGTKSSKDYKTQCGSKKSCCSSKAAQCDDKKAADDKKKGGDKK